MEAMSPRPGAPGGPRVFRVLVIEDNVEREQLLRGWMPEWARVVVARSAGQALGVIERDAGDVYGAILLDHDLGERARTAVDLRLDGMDVVGAIVEHIAREVPVLVHSMNPGRAPAMVARLEAAGFDVTRIPMGELTEHALRAWLEEAREAAGE